MNVVAIFLMRFVFMAAFLPVIEECVAQPQTLVQDEEAAMAAAEL
jgi:hypothetical protein